MSGAGRTLDPDALRYQEHWQPVLDSATRRLFERVVSRATGSIPTASTAVVDGPALRLLDLGAGTGALALLAAEHWPQASIIGLDVSAAMLTVAEERLHAHGREAAAGSVEWLVRDAQSTGLASDSIDVVVSSFVLQLVADRAATLREVRRLLRPGGIFGFVTWMAEEVYMLPDSEFDEAVYELGLDDPESAVREPKASDYESVEVARAELRAAGFDEVDARSERIDFSWSRDAYLHFKEAYDERELFESLDRADRARLRETVQGRWQDLAESAFIFEAPLVAATALAR